MQDSISKAAAAALAPPPPPPVEEPEVEVKPPDAVPKAARVKRSLMWHAAACGNRERMTVAIQAAKPSGSWGCYKCRYRERE